MSFRPIDLQVNIAQINHVARTQQNEQAHPQVVQTHQQTHIAREALRTQTTVLETGKSKEDEALKDALARDEDPGRHGRGDSEHATGENNKRDRQLPGGKLFENYDKGNKGSVLDVER